MIVILRQMLFGITTAALFSAVMLALVRKSALQEVIRLVTGMLMIAALLGPLSGLQMPSIWGWATAWMAQESAVQQQNEGRMWTSFAAAIAQIIEEQAAQAGILCQATVTMAQAEEAVSVGAVEVVSGVLSAENRKALQEIVTRYCGNAVQQHYTEEAGWVNKN